MQGYGIDAQIDGVKREIERAQKTFERKIKRLNETIDKLSHFKEFCSKSTTMTHYGHLFLDSNIDNFEKCIYQTVYDWKSRSISIYRNDVFTDRNGKKTKIKIYFTKDGINAFKRQVISEVHNYQNNKYEVKIFNLDMDFLSERQLKKVRKKIIKMATSRSGHNTILTVEDAKIKALLAFA